eukprot:255328-Amphidinium_carterae.1
MGQTTAEIRQKWVFQGKLVQEPIFKQFSSQAKINRVAPKTAPLYANALSTYTGFGTFQAKLQASADNSHSGFAGR